MTIIAMNMIDVWFKCKKEIEKQRKSALPIISIVRMFFRFKISNEQARTTENIKLVNDLDKVLTHIHWSQYRLGNTVFPRFSVNFDANTNVVYWEKKRNTRFMNIKPKSSNDKVFEIAFSRLNFKKEKNVINLFFNKTYTNKKFSRMFDCDVRYCNSALFYFKTMVTPCR